MKLPVTWLRDYVDFDDTIEGLADRLTFAGVEVEGVETVGLRAEGVVVGEVRKVEKHPDADKLTVCTVFDGKEELQVVCGAPNAREGMHSAFAPVGAVLANGTRLKKAKLRGVASFGMLCAEDELGLSESHAGIMELGSEHAPGTALPDVLGSPETVLELEITPNRPDCLSIIGIAREVATLYGKPLKRPSVEYPEEEPGAETRTRVTVEDPEGCPRYTARIIRDVAIRPAPEWMQKRLTLAGIRPINNLVDITNFVLLECGHPLHAFDQALLEEGRIVVRRGQKGESITALDESTHELDESVLLIADARRPVAVAGIMGGMGSEIRDDTSAVLLESACFSPPLIRATSRKLDLRSESSYRFERGTDIENVDWASRRAAALMVEFAGGHVASGVVDVYATPPTAREVSCRWERVRKLVGVEAGNDTIRDAFTALDLEVVREDADSCTIRIPSFRGDLEREVDLIEEFARIHGLDKIPAPAPRGCIVPDVDDRHAKASEALRTVLVGLGLSEAVHYSLVSDGLLDPFSTSGREERVTLPNPVSQDQSVLRTSLIPQMVETLGRNHARQCSEMACFEMGRTFHRKNGDAPREEERVCVGLMGPVGRQDWGSAGKVEPTEAFAWLKGIWENIAGAQQLAGWQARQLERPYFSIGQAVELLVEGRAVGVLGVLTPEIAGTWRIQDAVAVMEVGLEPLLAGYLEATALESLAVFPSVIRDMALVVDDGIKHDEIVSVIKAAAPPELENIRLFDIFTGKAVGPGKKSLGYSLTYRSNERTLTDEQANDYHNRVKAALKQHLHVDVREG